MFTGIVECMGPVVGIEEAARGVRRIAFGAPFASELREGDSVAVDGVCLTVVRYR